MIFKIRVLVAFTVTLSGFIATLFWRSTGPVEPPGPTYRLHNSGLSLPKSDYAIATFLTGQAADDTYYTATRMLTHQLLHAPTTKLNESSSISFLVLCSQSVTKEQKNQLSVDGATVVEVEDVPVNWWIYSGVTRWQEQFTKLRIFQMEEYKRILFIDADTLILSPMDDIFEETEVGTMMPTLTSRKGQIKWDEANLPGEWFFAARSDNALTGERDHPTPPLPATSFSAGFFMIAPNRQIYTYLQSVMSHYRRFDPFTMEQSLLNYVYRREGVMPWRELDWRWSATWPTDKDAKAGVASLHEKLWDRGPQELMDMWNRKKGEMMRYHEKREQMPFHERD